MKESAIQGRMLAETLRVSALSFLLNQRFSLQKTQSLELKSSSGNNNMVKREKGLWRMPWRIEAKKAVVSCEKRRGGANIL